MAQKNTSVKTKKKSTKTKGKDIAAFRFLCIVLALVTLLIAVVCVFADKRNKELLTESTKPVSQSTQASQENGAESNVSADNTEAASSTSEPTKAETTKVESTQPETTLPPVTVADKPGTINNPTIISISDTDWHLTLVNSSYRIPDNYEPDLVYVCNSSERLDRRVAEHYEKMYNAALEDGVTLTPCSGYRSYELQERNYNNKVSFYESQGYSTEDAKVKAATIIMPPGSSEHNLGFAMDIVCVDEWFEGTKEFAWLTEHAADYGFIMRYPKDKQDITKVIYEPWHWRYVGVELAKELKSSGQVLEEYMGVA